MSKMTYEQWMIEYVRIHAPELERVLPQELKTRGMIVALLCAQGRFVLNMGRICQEHGLPL